MKKLTTMAELAGRFRDCAASDPGHGLKLHRIHLQSATKTGSFQSSVVLDCRCGQRWLLRVLQGDVVAVDRDVLEDLRRGRDGQTTAPPGFPGSTHSR
jgi:hypothetical protein